MLAMSDIRPRRPKKGNRHVVIRTYSLPESASSRATFQRTSLIRRVEIHKTRKGHHTHHSVKDSGLRINEPLSFDNDEATPCLDAFMDYASDISHDGQESEEDEDSKVKRAIRVSRKLSYLL